MFHISEERINKSRANNYYCEKVTDEFPQELLTELKILSKESVIKVPIRHRGITSCQPLMCYWNANIISQTFGGMPVYGWIISHTIKNGIRTEGKNKGKKFAYGDEKSNHFSLIGHGCWMTPEGKLVDVTKPNEGEHPDKTFRYFLPTDKLLKLNSNNDERLKDFEYTNSPDGIKKIMQDNCGDLAKGLMMSASIFMRNTKGFHDLKNEEFCSNAFFEESFNYKDYTNKIIDPWGFPSDLGIDDILKNIINDDKFRTVFSPHMGVVTESSPLIKTTRYGANPRELILEAERLNKNLFELNNQIDWSRIFIPIENSHRVATQGHPKSSVVGISTTNGKSIYNIPPKAEVVSNHELPRNKKRRKKIEKKAKNSVFSPQELLTLNNEYLFPHPYLCKKNSNVPISI